MNKIYSRPRIRLPKIFIIIAIAFSTVRIVLNAILPIFDTLCQEEAKSMATLITNKQTTIVMEQHSYNELFSLEKDNEGNITMIKANVNPINSITSDIAINIQNEINKAGKKNVSIALGSFSGFKLLAGKGPQIPITISSIGNVETELKSEFIEKGINQTLHRVYLQVICKVSILTPYNDITQNIKNQVLLAENMIIGKIPETFYNINGIDENDAVEFIQ